MNLRPFLAVLEREVLKLFRQRSRLIAAMVRPLIWLFVIGAGFGALMEGPGGGSYQRFLVPGVLGMTLLFGAMLSALATVYDKESGVMRMLVVAPLPHYWIVIAKVLGSTIAALLQAFILLALLALLGYLSGDISFGQLALGLLCTALASAALGMLIAAWTGTLEHYALMMNLVIFPVFFLSGSLYPVQGLPDWLRVAAMVNPHTYGVDLLKHALVESAADFSVITDMTAALGFTAAAVAIACLRFSRDDAFDPLIHALRGRRAR